MDTHEQIFWSLSAMTNAYFDPGDADATWLGFADFRLQQSTFYLRVERGTGKTTVWLDRKQQVAETFDDFLNAYTRNPLFWRKPPKHG